MQYEAYFKSFSHEEKPFGEPSIEWENFNYE
jgi:hypothetical protein